MTNLKPVVLNALKNSAALTALVGTKIYFHYPDQFTNLPSISYRELDKRGDSYSDDKESAREYYFVIDIWNKSSTSAIEAAVESVMESLDFTLQSAPDLFEKGTKIYHKAMTFVTKRMSE